MKTYWCVKTEFYDNGTVKACISSRQAKSMPENKSKETPIADCYIDWFENEAEAKSFLKEARAA